MNNQQAVYEAELSRSGVAAFVSRGVRRTGPGRRHEVLGWGGYGSVVLGLGFVAALVPHRIWGLIAAAGCRSVAVAVAALRRRGPRWGYERGLRRSGWQDRRRFRVMGWPHLSRAVAIAGAVVLPLLVLVLLTDRAQLAIAEVERSADLLMHAGSLYVPGLSAVADYYPYLPGMAVFGLLHALLGNGPLKAARWRVAGIFPFTMAGAAAALARLPPRRKGRGSGIAEYGRGGAVPWSAGATLAGSAAALPFALAAPSPSLGTSWRTRSVWARRPRRLRAHCRVASWPSTQTPVKTGRDEAAGTYLLITFEEPVRPPPRHGLWLRPQSHRAGRLSSPASRNAETAAVNVSGAAWWIRCPTGTVATRPRGMRRAISATPS